MRSKSSGEREKKNNNKALIKEKISHGRELANNSKETSFYYVKPKSRKNLPAEKKRQKQKIFHWL